MLARACGFDSRLAHQLVASGISLATSFFISLQSSSRAHSAAPRFRTRPAVAGLRFGAALWTVVFRFCPKYRFCPSFARGSTLILLLPLSKLQPLRWGVIWYRRFAAFFNFIEISVLTVLCRNPLKRNGFKGFLF